MKPMEYVYSFAVALFLTIALIPLLIRFSEKLRLVDEPGAERKMHHSVMPRSGGIAIIAGVFIPLAFTIALDNYLTSLFIGCAIIVFFGLLDDKTELSYQWKLFGQALAAIVVMAGGIVIYKVPFLGMDAAPVWISYPLTFVFLLGVVNGVNFSDGLDGLAAGTSLMALGTIAVLASITGNDSVLIIALTVCGAIMGFLRFNTHPARIFMGDAGSQFLGFITVCLAILVTQADSSALNTFLPVLLLGLPIMDILQVVPVRMKKKLPLPGPDREHFHHQLVKLEFHHHEVVAIIYLLQFVMMTGAYVLRFESDVVLMGFYIVYLVIVLGVLLLAHLSGFRVREKSVDFRRKDRRNKFLRKFGWLHVHGGSCILAMLVAYFVISPLLLSDVAVQLSGAAVILALVFGGLAVFTRLPASVLARTSCYTASAFLAYLISTGISNSILLHYLDALLALMVVVLAVAIRTTRRDQFRLDTQDLLIFLMIVIVPLLPFSLDRFAVGSIALRMAVLMYSCEFLLAREGQKKFRYLSAGSTFGLIAVGLAGL